MLNNYKNTCMIKFYNLGGGLTSNIKQSKIATEAEAYAMGGSGTPNGNKACTNARAQALGCKALSNYSSNQLVPKSSLSKKKSYIVVTGICQVTINWSGGSVGSGTPTCIFVSTLQFDENISNSKYDSIFAHFEGRDSQGGRCEWEETGFEADNATESMRFHKTTQYHGLPAVVTSHSSGAILRLTSCEVPGYNIGVD